MSKRVVVAHSLDSEPMLVGRDFVPSTNVLLSLLSLVSLSEREKQFALHHWKTPCLNRNDDERRVERFLDDGTPTPAEADLSKPGIRLAGAVILGCLLFASACHPSIQTKVSEGSDNWSAFCETTDCSAFPAGYLTEKVGRYTFYFPLSARDRLGPSNPDVRIERGPAGEVRRAAKLIARANILKLDRPCCESLATHFGLERPSQYGFADPWIVELHARAGAGATYGKWIETRRLPEFKSSTALPDLGLPSFDENFWLVHDEGPWPDPKKRARRKVLLVSKEPVIFGRHVVALCSNVCTVQTVQFSEDKQINLPHVVIKGISDTTPDDELCDVDSVCDASKQPFKPLPDSIRWVGNILESLMRRPLVGETK